MEVLCPAEPHNSGGLPPSLRTCIGHCTCICPCAHALPCPFDQVTELQARFKLRLSSMFSKDRRNTGTRPQLAGTLHRVSPISSVIPSVPKYRTRYCPVIFVESTSYPGPAQVTRCGESEWRLSRPFLVLRSDDGAMGRRATAHIELCYLRKRVTALNTMAVLARLLVSRHHGRCNVSLVSHLWTRSCHHHPPFVIMSYDEAGGARDSQASTQKCQEVSRTRIPRLCRRSRLLAHSPTIATPQNRSLQACKTCNLLNNARFPHRLTHSS